MVRNLVGPPVTGEDFIGREKEVKNAWKALCDTNSLLLSSPRRVGKSSFARKLLEKADNEGWYSIYIDVKGLENETAFSEALLSELEKARKKVSVLSRAKSRLESLFSSVKKVNVYHVGVEIEKSPATFYQQLDNALNLDKRALIVVDELVQLLQKLVEIGDVRRAEMFLNWLRNIRQRETGKITWIFCSSVSIGSFVMQNKLHYTINDLENFELGAMDYHEAENLLTRLSQDEGSPLSNEQVDYVLNELDWLLPYFIQLFFSKYKEKEEYSSMTIEKATKTILMGLSSDSRLSTWNERLHGYGQYEQAARSMLNYLCLPQHKSDKTTLIGIIAKEIGVDNAKIQYPDVKDLLEAEGYIVENNHDIHFRSPLIRAYWYRKYGDK